MESVWKAYGKLMASICQIYGNWFHNWNANIRELLYTKMFRVIKTELLRYSSERHLILSIKCEILQIRWIGVHLASHTPVRKHHIHPQKIRTSEFSTRKLGKRFVIICNTKNLIELCEIVNFPSFFLQSKMLPKYNTHTR